MTFSLLMIVIGLLLVLEGIAPLVAPKVWKETFRRAIALTDGQLRFAGLAAVLSGLVLLGIFSLSR